MFAVDKTHDGIKAVVPLYFWITKNVVQRVQGPLRQWFRQQDRPLVRASAARFCKPLRGRSDVAANTAVRENHNLLRVLVALNQLAIDRTSPTSFSMTATFQPCSVQYAIE